jgi:hypothetical protein
MIDEKEFTELIYLLCNETAAAGIALDKASTWKQCLAFPPAKRVELVKHLWLMTDSTIELRKMIGHGLEAIPEFEARRTMLYNMLRRAGAFGD